MLLTHERQQRAAAFHRLAVGCREHRIQHARRRVECAEHLVQLAGQVTQRLDLGAELVALPDRIKTRLRPCVPLDPCRANHADKIIALGFCREYCLEKQASTLVGAVALDEDLAALSFYCRELLRQGIVGGLRYEYRSLLRRIRSV